MGQMASIQRRQPGFERRIARSRPMHAASRRCAPRRARSRPAYWQRQGTGCGAVHPFSVAGSGTSFSAFMRSTTSCISKARPNPRCKRNARRRLHQLGWARSSAGSSCAPSSGTRRHPSRASARARCAVWRCRSVEVGGDSHRAAPADGRRRGPQSFQSPAAGVRDLRAR